MTASVYITVHFPLIAIELHPERKDVIESAIAWKAKKLIEADPKLSENRAREIAGASIVNAYQAEVRELNDWVNAQVEAGTLSPEAETFYEASVDAPRGPDGFTGIVIELTGTRTLIMDQDAAPPIH